MKKLLFLLSALTTLPAFADILPPSKASQAEVNAGVNDSKYITPATLSGFSLAQSTGGVSIATLNNYSNTLAAFTQSSTNNYVTLNNVVKRWNVMNYGASGTGNKDLDSPAFKTAWDNARNYGGVVYAPRGLYTDTNSYAIPNSSTNGSHGVQGGTEIFMEGDGMDATIVQVACTNATYLNCLGQLVGLKGLTLYNVNRTTSSITNLALSATNFVGGSAGVAGLFNSVKIEGFWMGADIGAHDGFRARSIELRDCYIGMRLSGYSDGVIVEGRSDACKAGVVVGGLVPKYGISRINGIQLKMEGNGDGYHVIVGGGCNGVWISGAFEQTTNAAVAIGYPPNLLPNNSYSETTTAGPVTIHGLWGNTQVAGDVFCKLFVKCARLSINASRGGDLIVSTSAAADATQWEVVNSQWAGVLMTFSTASTIDGTGQSDWAAYRYSWNEMGLYSAVSNTWASAGFFYGQNGQFGTLKANASWFTNQVHALGGVNADTAGLTGAVANASSGQFSNVTSAFLIETNVHIVEHFIGGNVTSGSIGALGWTVGGTAPTTYTETEPSPQHFGVMKCATSTSSNSASQLFLYYGSGVSIVTVNKTNWTSRFTFKIADTNWSNVYIGVGGAAATPTYQGTIPAGFWMFVTNGNAGQYFAFQNRVSTGDATPSISLSTVRVDTNWHTATIYMPPDSTGVYYSVDNENPVAISANWPSGYLTPAAGIVTGDGQSKALWLDKWEFLAIP